VRRRLAARLLQSLIVVAIVTTISFFVIHLAPGDPFSYDSPNITEAVRQHWRVQFGYDRPLPVQFVRYLSSIAHGELGYSFSMHDTVAHVLESAVPATLLLMGIALSISFFGGMAIGVMQATRRDSVFDRLSSWVMLVFYSLPDFWGALMVLFVFAFWIPILPPSGAVDPVGHEFMSSGAAFVDRIKHLILPVAALVLLTTAGIARYQRSAMLEVLPSDYIRTARAKGVPEREIIWRHALRTALTPMVTVFGLLLPGLLGGALFVEKVFSWNGMGALTANAIGARDYDVVTAAVIVGSIMVVVGNLVADLLHAFLDPRVRE
jgi:peptide/nickel transport system permease protein